MILLRIKSQNEVWLLDWSQSTLLPWQLPILGWEERNRYVTYSISLYFFTWCHNYITKSFDTDFCYNLLQLTLIFIWNLDYFFEVEIVTTWWSSRPGEKKLRSHFEPRCFVSQMWFNGPKWLVVFFSSHPIGCCSVSWFEHMFCVLNCPFFSTY